MNWIVNNVSFHRSNFLFAQFFWYTRPEKFPLTAERHVPFERWLKI